jgi:hypothetical protein
MHTLQVAVPYLLLQGANGKSQGQDSGEWSPRAGERALLVMAGDTDAVYLDLLGNVAHQVGQCMS